MKEIEIKILNVDKKIITKKLLQLGAKKVSSVILTDKQFDFDDGRIKKNKETFRLRKNGDKTEIAYKHSRDTSGNFLICEELETIVKDYDIMENIIKSLGLKCIKHREKKRTSFVLGKLKFEIDENPRIPPYLEIEGDKKEVEKAVKLLGFNMKQTTNMTTSQVLKLYKQDSDYITF